MRLLPPKPVDVLDLRMADGASIRVRRHGNTAGPRLVLSHGNGFAIDAYYPFWRHFLADCEVILFDQRNHGWNARHDRAGHTQARMAEDVEVILAAVTAAFGPRRTAGAFHSLSATVSLLHFRTYGLRWDALILFDPPLAPPPGHPLHEAARDFEYALSDWARQRQRRFASPAELAAHFKRTRRMRRWVDGAAELMAQAITRPVDGAYELVCPPDYEADVYLQNSRAPAWSVLPAIAPHLLVIASDYEAPDVDPPGRVSEALAREFGIAVVRIPDSGHLLQIERPAAVASALRRHLRSRGFPLAAQD